MRKELTEEQILFLSSLVEQYSDILTQYAYRYFNYQTHMFPAAQDAVQETFIKAVKNIDTLMVHENQIGWLKRSLRNVLWDYSRNMKNNREYSNPNVAEMPAVTKQTAQAALERWEHSCQWAMLLEAVAEILTDDEQTTFYDHFLVGLTVNETSINEEVSSDTIRGRISRIRKKLKKHFQHMCCFILILHYLLGVG